MRNLRLTCAAVVLTLALALSALAGQIQCPGAPEPGETQSPPSGSQSTGDTSPADVPTCGLLTILDLVF